MSEFEPVDLDGLVPELDDLEPELDDVLDGIPRDPVSRRETRPTRPSADSRPTSPASNDVAEVARPLDPPIGDPDELVLDDLVLPELPDGAALDSLMGSRSPGLATEDPLGEIGPVVHRRDESGAATAARPETIDDHQVPVSSTTTTLAATPSAIVAEATRNADPLMAPCTDPGSPSALPAPKADHRRTRLLMALVLLVLVGVAGALFVVGRRSSSKTDNGSVAVTDDADTSVVATAAQPLVDVYDAPNARQPRMSLSNPTALGGPLVFLVEDSRGPWLRVDLPVRPPGSTGWVRSGQVHLSKHHYEVVVHLADHDLVLLENGQRAFRAPIGLGTRDVPAPGRYYVTDLLQPPSSHSRYGAYAFGLSGSPNTLSGFTSGEGIVAIHGTNDPSVIGKDGATGSIAMTDTNIDKLVGTLPLGTPVEVQS